MFNDVDPPLILPGKEGKYLALGRILFRENIVMDKI